MKRRFCNQYVIRDRPELLGKEKEWHQLASIEQIEEGVSRFDYAGHACFVNKKGDELQVFDSRCPHQVTNIPLLALDGTTLTCPKHNWKFNVENGECIVKGNRPLNRIEHKIEDDMPAILGEPNKTAPY